MATKYYRDNAGNYVGAFDGALPPVGSIEVSSPPSHASCTFSNGAWSAFAASREDLIEAAFRDRGLRSFILLRAFYKKVVNSDNTEILALKSAIDAAIVSVQ